MVKLSTCVVTTLSLISVSSWTLYFKFDVLLETVIRSQFVLEEGNELWKNWINVPIGLLGYKYYFFEVVNPNEVLRGARVKVREHGPYCFSHRRYKRITGWGANNETVKYMEHKINYFDAECSAPNTLDDTFTMINPLVGALGQAISDLLGNRLPLSPITSPFVYSMVNTFLDLHGQSLFMKKSVREVIYGFKVNLLETIETLTSPLREMGIKLEALPPSPPDNMFGLLYGRNDTPEGEFEVYTGKGSTAKFLGSFKTVKGASALSWWKGDYCNEIRGGDGSLFPPFTTRESKLSAYAPDVCRAIDFSYKRDGEFKGIKGYVFGLGSEAFASPKTNPSNECFCIHKSKRSRCDKYNGLFDLGGCQSGAPLLLSLPHYLDVHPVPRVDGLAPNRKIHDTYVILEPTTSAPVYGSKKLMFSLRLEQVPFLRNFQSITADLIPFAWAEEAGGLTDELAVQFKQIVDILSSAKSYILLFALTITLITLVALCLMAVCTSKRSRISPSDKRRIPSLYDTPVKENVNGSAPLAKKENDSNESSSTSGSSDANAMEAPVETAAHLVPQERHSVDNDGTNLLRYPLITPNFIASNFSTSPVPTPPRYRPPPPAHRSSLSAASFTVARKRRSVSHDEVDVLDNSRDTREEVRMSSTSPAQLTNINEPIDKINSPTPNEDDARSVNEAVIKLGELDDVSNDIVFNRLTFDDIDGARAVITANENFFADDGRNIKSSRGEDATSTDETGGMFNSLMNAYNKRINTDNQRQSVS